MRKHDKLADNSVALIFAHFLSLSLLYQVIHQSLLKNRCLFIDLQYKQH